MPGLLSANSHDKGKKRLVVPFQVKSTEADSSKNVFTIVGMASVYGVVDSYSDVVMSGAFSDDLKKNGIRRPILWQHDRWEPIGSGEFREVAEGLEVTISLPSDDTLVSGRIIPQVKIGSVTGLSIGYRTLAEEQIQGDGDKKVNQLIKIKLVETSLVTFPANEEALITDVRSFVPDLGDFPMAPKDTHWDKLASIGEIRQATGSGNRPSLAYKSAFFSVKADSDSFESYSFPRLGMVGGKLCYIPKAIASAVGELTGDRKNLKIEESEIKEIKTQLNRLYEEMHEEPPFTPQGITLISEFTLKNMSIMDLPRIWDNGIVLTAKARKYIAKLVFSAGSEGDEQRSEDIEPDNAENRSLTDYLKDSLAALSKAI